MAEGKNRRVLWTADAATPGGATSLDILLGWISTLGNYDMYRGGANHSGKTKEVLCGEVVALMKEQRIPHRSNSDVRSKNFELETSYRKACDWRAQTGQGILESNAPNCELQINSYLRTLCKHYDILDPIMSERPSAQTAVTSETIDEQPKKRSKLGNDETSSNPLHAWSKSNENDKQRVQVGVRKVSDQKSYVRKMLFRTLIQN